MPEVTSSIAEIDIQRVAKLIIGRYGANAHWIAAARSDEMLKRGDLAGQKVWIRILQAIDAMNEKQRAWPTR
jgi:hypothetical protein